MSFSDAVILQNKYKLPCKINMNFFAPFELNLTKDAVQLDMSVPSMSEGFFLNQTEKQCACSVSECTLQVHIWHYKTRLPKEGVYGRMLEL